MARKILAASLSLSVLAGPHDIALAQQEWMQSADDTRGAALDPSVALDRKFDMREDPATYVSDVKDQSPWGTCWAFGPTSAAESSIYADLGLKVDLSERHLAWFAHTPITAADDPTQVGEGLYVDAAKTSPTKRINGGYWYDVMSAYASGVGPVLESAWPYHGKEGLTEYEVLRLMPEAWKQAYYQYELADKTDKELEGLLREKGCTTIDEYLEAIYALNKAIVEPASANNYSHADDWTIPETDEAGRSVRNQGAGFMVKDVNAMPPARHVDLRTQRPTLDDLTMAAVKQELRRGHGVATSYAAANPASSEDRPTYIRDKTWAHYTWKEASATHTVCIVGWDDDYPVENFNQGTVTEQTDGGPITYDMAPPGPGAWIVKNSWGKKDGTGTKKGGPLGSDLTQVFGVEDWGVDDSGYFYLSYYDQSLSEFASYSFMNDAPAKGTLSHQYDYLCSGTQHEISGAAELSAANVFDVKQDETLTSVGATTLYGQYNVQATYAIYKLREGATSPVDGELLGTVSCLYAYPGYHRELLAEPIPLNAGDRFSVVVTQSFGGANGEKTYAICAASAKTENAPRAPGEYKDYGKTVVNRGESWAYVNGRWQDWVDALAADTEFDPNEKVVDNPSIKAFAQAAERGAYRWVTSGTQTWRKGAGSGLALTFGRTERTGDTAAHVTGVSVDGKRLAEGAYLLSRASDGATVTLFAGFLEGLSVGSHRIEVALDDAQALEASFTVEGASPDSGNRDGGIRPRRDDGWYYHDDGMRYRDSTDSATGTASSGSPATVTRIAGANRYETMSKVVSQAFASSQTCVVASGATFADALSATGLAGALKAPVVLTDPASLSKEAASEIRRLGVRRAFLMGGEAALAPAVAEAVSSLGAEVVRVAGPDRASTSVEAMRLARGAGSSSDTVIVASGQGFADALSAGPWAWTQAMPVLLSGADGLLGADALAELGSDANVRRVVVLGGPSTVGDVASQLPARISCERIGGTDRYETARLVAERALQEGLSFSSVHVASGQSFADALAAGPAAGAKGGVLLLADPAGSKVASALKPHRDAVGSVYVVGGDAAVGPSAFEALRSVLG